MHSVILYQFDHSPFCIPIRQALTALGVPFRIEQVPVHDRTKVIQATNGNYYQVPMIVNGNDVIYESAPESQDVARYVDRKWGMGKLFPERLEGTQGILIPYLENVVEPTTFKLVDPKWIPAIPDLVERTMIIRHKERRFGRGCVDAWAREADALRTEAVRKLKPLDRMLAHTPFLTGDVPVYADFLLEGMLGNLTYRNYNSIPPELTSFPAFRSRLLAHRYS